MTKQPMDAVLSNPRIPTLPVVAVEVLRLTREPNVNLKEVGDVVQNDQALAVKIVRTVNSSYYGLAVPCATINQAIIYLGLNAVKALVLGFSLVESVDGVAEDDVGFDYVDYWRRAMYSAAAARELATLSESCDPEEAFLAALIQDMGMVALHKTFGDVYLQAIDLTEGEHRRLVEIEQKSLRMDHAQVGAALAEQWKLPPQLTQVIRYHHSSDDASEEWRSLVRCVQLATEFTSAAALGEIPQHVHRHASDWLGLESGVLEELLPNLGSAVAELSRLYQVDAGERFDHEKLMADAEEARIEHEVSMTKQLDSFASRASQAATMCGAYDAKQRARDELLVSVGCAFEDAISLRSSFALLLFEIDAYADVAQTFGIQVAELLSEHVGGILQQSIQAGVDGRNCLRLTNGCFGIVMSDADRRRAARKAESLRRQIESESISHTTEHGDEVSLSAAVSVGVAAVEPELQAAVDSAPSMLRIAEQALQAAVEAGRNCVRVFSPETRKVAA